MPAAPKSDPDAYTATFKAGGGFSDPWLVIRAESASQLQDRIDTALQNSLFAVVGNAAKDFATTYKLGEQLGARPVEAPVAESTPPAAPEPAAEAAPSAPQTPANDAGGQPWGAAQTGAFWPEPAEPAEAPAARPEPAAMTPPKTDDNGWPPPPAWAQ